MADSSLRPLRTTPVSLAALVAALPELHRAAQTDLDIAVSGISLDSRATQSGDLYLARAGDNSHGIEFLDQAIAAGATAVLTDPAASPVAEASGLPVVIASDPRDIAGRAAAIVYGQPARSLQLFGVTGTNGKTTTSWFLDSILRAAGMVTGLIGTVATVIAGHQVPSVRTTPEATDLQALLAVMLERGVGAVSMEVSSHALALGRVSGCHFACAGFTNLTQDHLDFHGDMESYFQAKASLFDSSMSALGVVSADDNAGRRLAQEATIPITTVAAENPGADWSWSASPAGTRLTHGDQLLELAVRLPGRFNQANAVLAAVMAATACGFSAGVIEAGIAALTAVPGRMEQVSAGQPFAVIVDYAHTPDAVVLLVREAAALAAAGSGKVCIVLGCGGDRDSAKRPLMGRAAAAADRLIITDDNPRSEDPAAIRRSMLSGTVGQPALVSDIGDRREAIRTAIAKARAGDVVIIAGKGHETGQQIGDVVQPFDDVAVAREELRSLGWDHRSEVSA